MPRNLRGGQNSWRVDQEARPKVVFSLPDDSHSLAPRRSRAVLDVLGAKKFFFFVERITDEGTDFSQ